MSLLTTRAFVAQNKVLESRKWRSHGRWVDTEYAMVVVLDVTGLVHQVVIVEITAHPRLQHHRGRDPQGSFDAGDVHPQVGVKLQEASARILGGLVDADERTLAAPVVPGSKAHRARAAQARRFDRHGGLHEGTFAPQDVIRVYSDIGGGESFGGGFELASGSCGRAEQHRRQLG